MKYLILLCSLISFNVFSDEYRLGVGISQVKQNLWDEYVFKDRVDTLSVSKYWNNGLGVRYTHTDGNDGVSNGVRKYIHYLSRLSVHYEYEFIDNNFVDFNMGYSVIKGKGTWLNGRGTWSDTDSGISYGVSYKYRLSNNKSLEFGWIYQYSKMKTDDKREYTDSWHIMFEYVF